MTSQICCCFFPYQTTTTNDLVRAEFENISLKKLLNDVEHVQSKIRFEKKKKLTEILSR